MRTCLVIALVALAAGALADGGLFAPWIHEIYEHEQVALLEWDAAAGEETLTILPGIQGDMREFAWVVPLPAVPTVTEADRAVFEELFAATRPLYRTRGSDCSCEDDAVDSLAPGDADNQVSVLSRDLVGIFDVLVLAADEAGSLVDSLDTWGYLHESNREMAEPILADYVARDWVFVAMRVDSSAFDPDYPEDYYWDGGIDPVTMTFTVDAPVYPMRISAISAPPRADVSVFTIADDRMMFAGARTRYANQLSDREWREIAGAYPLLASRLEPGQWLTRLERTMGAIDMDSDLAIVRSGERGEFRPINYSGLGEVGWFFGPVLLFWGWGRWRAGRAARA